MFGPLKAGVSVLGLLAATTVVGACTPGPAGTDRGVVTHIVDGDTLDVSRDGQVERIRLLNIDTPETVDPDEAVQCLGPEASAFLAQRIPVGTEVGLEYDDVRTDRYGRTLAAVYAPDGGLVNADIARAGLATTLIVDGNDRFYPAVLAAQQEASAAQRGLYSPDVACTLPGRMRALDTALAVVPVGSEFPSTASSTVLYQSVDRATGVLASADTLMVAFGGAHRGLIWAAYSAADLTRLAAAVVERRGEVEHRRSDLLARAQDAERREATDPPAPEPAPQPAPKPAPQPAPRRTPKSPAAPKPSPAPKSKPAPRSDSPGDPYPGYTGPRCYAPGGRTWKPC